MSDLIHGDCPMSWQDRIDNYVRLTKFPRSLFVAEDGRVVGTWIMGHDYRVKSGYYGGYPAGYLRRIAALFPDRRKVLHVFSGQVDLSAMPGDTVDSNPEVNPTWVADAHDLSTIPLESYDLVLADPPYSIEDAKRYQTTMVQRNVVMRSLAAGMAEGARVVWLDQVLPMYRKTDWRIEAVIGMVKSTNHRFRMLTVFLRRDMATDRITEDCPLFAFRKRMVQINARRDISTIPEARALLISYRETIDDALGALDQVEDFKE